MVSPNLYPFALNINFRNIDLSPFRSNPPELLPERYGISADSQESVDVSGIFYGGSQLMTVTQLLEELEKHYCDSVAVEFQHLQVSNHLNYSKYLEP